MTAKQSTSRRGKRGKAGMATVEGHGETAVRFRKNVLGTTREGIQILKPRGAPTSFTWQQLREAMPAVIEKAPA